MSSESDEGSEDYNYLFQVVLIGDSGVGKSSLLTRFTKSRFLDDTKSTIGLDFASKTLPIDGQIVKTQIWDTAGQERYRGLAKNYYRKTMGALIVYDITSRDSFENVEYWLEQVRTHAKKDVVVMIVGNKCDLADREIQTTEVEEFAHEKNISFMETSARNATNVDEAFRLIIHEIYRLHANQGIDADDNKPDLEEGGAEVVVLTPTDGGDGNPPKSTCGC